MSGDLLTGNIPSSTSSKRKGVKRLNRKPLMLLCLGAFVVSGLIMMALSGMGRKTIVKVGDGDAPMPTSSFVDGFLADRPDGVIGDETVEIEKPPREVFSTALYTPLPEKAPVPVPAQVVEKPKEKSELEKMLEKQRLADLMARMEQERLAMGAPSSVNFNRKSVSNIVEKEEQPNDENERREEVNARIAGAEQGLNSIVQLIETRIKADDGLSEQDAPLPLPQETAVEFNTGSTDQFRSGGSRGATRSRGGVMLSRRQVDIRPEAGEERIPDSLRNEFLLRQREADDNYLNHSRVLPITNSEIQAGTVIRANLVTGINSELPGQIIAQVSRNVFDSQFGEHILIPQGAKLIGQYRDNIAFGENRILVGWDRLLFPDGTSINLEGMQGHDVAGFAGFKDKVNNHFGRLFVGAFFLSVLSSGVSAVDINTRATAEINTSGGQSISTGSLFAQELAQELAKIGTAVAERNLNIQPTIIIRPGYQFAVMVNRDIILPPYVPTHELIEPRYAERDTETYTHPVRPFGKRRALFDKNSVRQVVR